MSCRCESNGLGAISDPIHRGAWFRLGVEINGWGDWEDLFVDLDEIRRALNDSGYVVPDVQVWKQAGVVNAFVVVEGKSGREYGQALHLRDAVLSVMSNLHVLNYGSVQFEAETYNASSGTPTTTVVAAPRNQTIAGSVTQTIASGLGVSQKEAMILALGGGALLLLLVLKR